MLGTSEVDFDGDEVQLYEYWSSELVDNMPRDILKKMGLKMTTDEATGEAEFVEREDFVSRGRGGKLVRGSLLGSGRSVGCPAGCWLGHPIRQDERHA